jgi:predicted PurR-regulated permease PerM
MAVNVAIIGIFAILLIGALYYARSFALPIVLAVMITLTFAPLVRHLGRLGIAAPISAVILVTGMALGLAGASALLSDPVSRMVQQAPEVVRELRLRFASIGRPFEVLSQAGKEVEAIADGVEGAADAQKVVVARPGLLAWAAGTLADFGTTLVATLLLAPFLLASGDKLKAKLVQAVPGLSRKKQSLRVLRDIENEVSLYLLTVTAINCGLGIAVGTAMALLGMPSPVLWGLAAAVLNFVPYVGALAGILLALAVATVTFTSVGMVLAPPLAYFAIQLVEGAFITPTILGRRLELSTVAILVTLALTTWMWGIIGAVIGVPVLVMVKAFCDQFESLGPLRVFLSAEIPANGNGDDAETASGPATVAADKPHASPPLSRMPSRGG